MLQSIADSFQLLEEYKIATASPTVVGSIPTLYFQVGDCIWIFNSFQFYFVFYIPFNDAYENRCNLLHFVVCVCKLDLVERPSGPVRYNPAL